MAFTLPPLPYDYDALEPHIDGETMRLHHDKHHAAYTNNLNAALQGTEWENADINNILAALDNLPESARTKVRNNGGGYANHDLFWQIMSPNGGGGPTGELADAINSTFGSLDELKKKIEEKGMGQFGSGWAWLTVANGNELHVHGLPNQDSPVMHGEVPILGVDVWEHAYYKKYGPGRADYLKAWWNVVNWEEVARRYAAAKS